MKLPFQRVVIDPKWTPDEELMVVLLRHYALSRDISERAGLKDFYHNSSHRSPKFMILDALERRLDGALQYTILSHGTSLIMDENVITTAALWR